MAKFKKLTKESIVQLVNTKVLLNSVKAENGEVTVELDFKPFREALIKQYGLKEEEVTDCIAKIRQSYEDAFK